MRKLLLSFLALSSFTTIMAQQSFLGLRDSYYNGTHSVLSNPANIAGSPRKWDVNLFSLNASASNNVLELSQKNISNFEKIINDYSKTGKYENFSANMNVDVLGPSFMFRLNDKHSIGITTRARFFNNIKNFNIKLFETIKSNIKDLEWNTNTTPLSIKDQTLHLNAFSEMGATWAGTIFQKDGHYIKLGATAKYVQGAANVYMAIQDLKGNLSIDTNKEEATLTATGTFSMVNSGINFNDFKPNNLLKSNASGVGFDIGAVYEFKPEDDKPYKIKAGFSITDIGSIKYTPLKDQAFIYRLSGTTVTYKENNFQDKLNEVLKKEEIGSYSMSLPTALNLNADYHIHNGFFVELSGLINLSNKNNPQNPYYSNEIALTPRFEKRWLGLYIPITYNDLSKTNIGTAIRLGPLSVGSRSIWTALSDKGKQADVFIGIRFGR